MPSEHTRLRALTRAEVSLADWHRFWRHGLFLCAVGLMSASWFALHWLLVLVGIPDPFAAVVAVVIEVGMAGTATTATTIRKPEGGYYASLWLIFSFLMLLAQGANVGHAVIAVGQRLGDFPQGLPHAAVYIFAGAFAALFPLGGTLFIHVSGFLRVHGADAAWIDEGARTVGERTQASRARTPRKTRTDERAPDTRGDDERRGEERAPEPSALALTDAQMTLPEEERAHAAYDLLRANGVDPTAPRVIALAAVTKHPATVRRWLADWRAASPAVDAEPDDDLDRLVDRILDGPVPVER